VGSSNPFSYAVYRLVPRVERGERINAGVIVFCRPLRYLGARTALDEQRLGNFERQHQIERRAALLE